jgi:gamma-glutamylcyclotransferase (GGCT)/AIG2-like uncharacterized protein YtfP
MTVNVFTYGSLMFPEVWGRVVAGRYASLAATLVDHARFAVHEQDYPGMTRAAAASVDGVLYLGVDDSDVARLDDFEGADYRRDVVVVRCADGRVREASTYLYLPTDRLLASPWDRDGFALERFLATYCRDKLGS